MTQRPHPVDRERLEAHLAACRKAKKAEVITRIQAFLALRRNDPQMLALLIARARVSRGIGWFSENAPTPGWWRNCLDPGRGSRIRMRYSEESVVARVFEYDPRFADQFGYVHDWKAFAHFFGPYGWSSPTTRLGFYNHWKSDPAPKRYPEVTITDEMLDKEWSEFVENPPGDWLLQYRNRMPSQSARKPRKRSLLSWPFGWLPSPRPEPG